MPAFSRLQTVGIQLRHTRLGNSGRDVWMCISRGGPAGLKTAYLGLGSNLGDREANLRAAIERLRTPDLRVLRISPVYETEPVDYTEQRWFLNLVVEAETDLFPMQLLARVASIERALGRVRVVPKGPRTIDIDILLYGKAVIRSAALEIPHPRMARAPLRSGASGGPGPRFPAPGCASNRERDARRRPAANRAPGGRAGPTVVPLAAWRRRARGGLLRERAAFRRRPHPRPASEPWPVARSAAVW